jgi:hypothetical protein
MPDQSPATKQDLIDLKREIRQEIRQDLQAMEDRLIERSRDMQSELLRGFAAFSESQTFRLRKVEADQSNLDASLSGRVNVLERRLLEIEIRLGKQQ